LGNPLPESRSAKVGEDVKTREFINEEYLERFDVKFTIESLSYLCRMLWLCRSDKLRQTEIPFLVDISNSAFQASEQFSHLPKLPVDDRAYRMGEVFFKDCNHRDLERAVIAFLEKEFSPEETPKPGFLSSIKEKLKK